MNSITVLDVCTDNNRKWHVKVAMEEMYEWCNIEAR